MMRRILSLLALSCLYSFPVIADQKYSHFEDELATMVSLVESEFLNGQNFTVFDGLYKIVAKLSIVEDSSSKPNAGLEPISDTEMGVGVNQALLDISDTNAVLFALAHELGHGFSEALLTSIQCAGINGAATEVIADLGAMMLLHKKGISFHEIARTVSNWRESGIFDAKASGDHPPGDERAWYVREAIAGLKEGLSFKTVVNDLIRNQLAADCP